MARHDRLRTRNRLGREAEAVCKRYLSNGHREGRYWVVGDVQNSPGRSMFVRLTGPESGKGAAGNGPMRRRPNMAICSTSSARAAACVDFQGRRRRSPFLPQPAEAGA